MHADGDTGTTFIMAHDDDVEEDDDDDVDDSDGEEPGLEERLSVASIDYDMISGTLLARMEEDYRRVVGATNNNNQSSSSTVAAAVNVGRHAASLSTSSPGAREEDKKEEEKLEEEQIMADDSMDTNPTEQVSHQSIRPQSIITPPTKHSDPLAFAHTVSHLYSRHHRCHVHQHRQWRLYLLKKKNKSAKSCKEFASRTKPSHVSNLTLVSPFIHLWHIDD